MFPVFVDYVPLTRDSFTIPIFLFYTMDCVTPKEGKLTYFVTKLTIWKDKLGLLR
jgi:hypothetical protein